jgi:hypothetical protein
MERDGWRCVASGRTDETLCIHHRRYYKNPWDAPDGALETVSETIHALIEPHARGIRAMYPDSCVSASDIYKAQREAVLSIAEMEFSGDVERCVKNIQFGKVDLLVSWKIANLYGLYKPKVQPVTSPKSVSQ